MHKKEVRLGRNAGIVAAVVLATIATAGCAAHPDDIAPQDVNDAQYSNYSCPDLANEYRRLNEAIASASDYQRSLRINDVYGYIPAPLPLMPMPKGRMMGGDREVQIAYLRGEQAAAIQMAATKGCIRASPIPLAHSGFILR